MTRDPGGFTLLEVLVALAILGLAVVATIQGFAQGLRLLKLSGDHQRAMLIADEKARELVTPTATTEAGTEGAYAWQRSAKEIPAPELTPVGTTPAWRVYEITVQVSWANRYVELATLRVVPTASSSTSPDAPAQGSTPGPTDPTATSRGGRTTRTPGETPAAPPTRSPAPARR